MIGALISRYAFPTLVVSAAFGVAVWVLHETWQGGRAEANAAVSVPGAIVTDSVTWSLSVAIPVGVIVFAAVTAAGTVTVRFQNESGGAATVPAGTLTATVSRT